MKIEAVVVGGKVYNIKFDPNGFSCLKCALYQNRGCLLDEGCPLRGGEYYTEEGEYLKKGDGK